MARDEERFGDWLRATRTERGVTQLQLAEAGGTSRAFVTQVENGQFAPPSVDTLLRWADRLGVDHDEMLTRAGKPLPDLVERLKDLGFVRWLRAAMAAGYQRSPG